MVVCKFFQQGYCRYGNSCRFEHVYGSKYSYRAPQSQSRNEQDIVKSNPTFSHGFGSTNSASSIFQTAVQNISTFSNVPTHTLYGQSQPRASVFDRLGPHTNTFSNQNIQAKSLFAQANQSMCAKTQTQPVVNIFQSQNQTAAKSLFAQASQSIFGQHQPQTNFIEHQKRIPDSNNIGNVFQITEQATINVFSKQPNAFNSSANVFDQNNFNEDHIYSKMEDLSPAEVEAYESEDFRLGFIPELPPPRILCV